MRKSKQALALVLSVLMLTAILPFSAYADHGSLPFRDVPADAWYYPVVKRAYESGITKGTAPTTFEPNGTVTREMFLVMLFRAAKIQLNVYEAETARPDDPEATVYNFSDVPQGKWYSATIGCAAEMGVTNGIDSTHFGLGHPITREQMATMAARFMDARPHAALKPADNPLKAFADADQVSGWAEDAVEAMRVSGVLQGDSLQRANPKAHATRAEAAAVVLRLVDATERVSFVPAGTAWIRILRETDSNIEIKDPEAVQKIIRYLDNMPITAEYGLPAHLGGLYFMVFFDQNDQYLGSGRFDSQYFQFGHSTALFTVLPYLLPLTQAA